MATLKREAPSLVFQVDGMQVVLTVLEQDRLTQADQKLAGDEVAAELVHDGWLSRNRHVRRCVWVEDNDGGCALRRRRGLTGDVDGGCGNGVGL